LLPNSFRVKRAIDVFSRKQVAIKILKTSDPLLSKKLMLESFFNEIQILARCRHPNIVKIFDASFSGTMIKEAYPVRKSSIERSLISMQDCRIDTFTSDRDDESSLILKRTDKICYCVLKLAENGELYKMIESTDRFSESLSRTLFKQLIYGNPSDL
jgi:serine/threonine protein kinase